MLDKGKISSRQLIFLMTILVVSTELLFLPALIVKEAAEGAWFSVILSALFGAAVVLVAAAAGQKYPGKNILQYAEILLGKFFGKVTGFLLVTYLFTKGSIVLREFVELLETSFMPETPPIVFAATFALAAALAVRSGIEVMARTNELIFMLAYLITISMFVLLVKDIEPIKLLPVLGEGFVPAVRGALPAAGFMGELVLLAFLIPNLNLPKQAAGAGLWSILIISLTLITTIEFVIGIFGAKLVANSLFPALNMGRFIAIAGFLEHLDAFILIYWVIAVFIKLSLFYYTAVIGTAQLFSLKDYRTVVLPSGVIIVALSFAIFKDAIQFLDWTAAVWFPYAFFIELFIPLSLLVMAALKERKKAIG